MNSQSFGLVHLWAQADALSATVAVVLLAMSIASWTVIATKLWWYLRTRRQTRVLDTLWAEPSAEVALERLCADENGHPVGELARRARETQRLSRRHAQGPANLGQTLGVEEATLRTLRQGLGAIQARLEGGLTLLASIGSTAPFFGLLGTVWGIYHALTGIAASGQASLDKVAGPVGEALIMTAFGLAVALPAVLAYNACLRANRVLMAELDGWAHDLHVILVSGVRPAPVGESGKGVGGNLKLAGVA